MSQATETKEGAPETPEAPERHPALPPVAYPLLGLVFGAVLVWAFSRVLLALDKAVAPAVATFAALNILVGAALVASGPRVRRRPASFPLLVIAAVATVAIGVIAAPLEQRVEHAAEGGEHGAGGGATTVALVAKGLAWDKTELSMPAGAKVQLEVDNQDAGVPHNFSLYQDEAMTQALFTGETFNGVASHTYSFAAPKEPGTYHFRCDVHPQQMTGTVRVGAGGGEGGGEGGGGLQVVGKSLAFQPTELSAPGGGQITITFDNQDSGIPHNVTVLDGPDSSAAPLFEGEVFNGPAKREYTFKAPPPGKYFFRCDVHPQQMTGTLTVT